MPLDPQMIRPFIEKRLDYAHEMAGVEKDSIIRFEDSAYAAIEVLTNGNLGFTQYALMRILGAQGPKEPPYVVTGSLVESLGITENDFVTLWDLGRPRMIAMPLRS